MGQRERDPLGRLTLSSSFNPTINLLPFSFAAFNNSKCPVCNISKQPFVNTIVFSKSSLFKIYVPECFTLSVEPLVAISKHFW